MKIKGQNKESEMERNSGKLVSQIDDVGDLKRRALTIGFYGAVGYLGYRFVLKPLIIQLKRNGESADIITDINKQQATVMYNAMNPSGISWMRSWDNTDEAKIYAAARKVTNWKAVQQAYRNLYNRDLLSDLQSELDTEEYRNLLRILNNSIASSSPKTGKKITNRGMIIASKKNIRLRSTPDSSTGTYSFNSNILAVAPAGKFLGWATGVSKVDDNGVKYLEVMIKFKNEIPKGFFSKLYSAQNNKTLRFWVGAGAIYQFKYYKMMNRYGIRLYKGVSDMGLRKNFK